MSREDISCAVTRAINARVVEEWYSNNPYSATITAKGCMVQAMGCPTAVAGAGQVAILRNSGVSLFNKVQLPMNPINDYINLGVHVDVSESGEYVIGVTDSCTEDNTRAVYIYSYIKKTDRYAIQSVVLVDVETASTVYIDDEGMLNVPILEVPENNIVPKTASMEKSV